ncbi:hypothetical protein, partial [Methylogaea oryzae]|uniref:hypothetical protein n=1 Tax=Methylogaea oryzae TaxID=1295382 RepID=UPI00278C0571
QLAAGGVQEAHDMALIAQAASLASRIPFVHFFDGFRTSHEVNKLELIADEHIRAMIPDELVRAHRGRGLNPDNPSSAARRRTRTCISKRGKPSTRFTSACPPLCRRPWTASPASPAGTTACSTTTAIRKRSGWRW